MEIVPPLLTAEHYLAKREKQLQALAADPSALAQLYGSPDPQSRPAGSDPFANLPEDVFNLIITSLVGVSLTDYRVAVPEASLPSAAVYTIAAARIGVASRVSRQWKKSSSKELENIKRALTDKQSPVVLKNARKLASHFSTRLSIRVKSAKAELYEFYSGIGSAEHIRFAVRPRLPPHLAFTRTVTIHITTFDWSGRPTTTSARCVRELVGDSTDPLDSLQNNEEIWRFSKVNTVAIESRFVRVIGSEMNHYKFSFWMSVEDELLNRRVDNTNGGLHYKLSFTGAELPY